MNKKIITTLICAIPALAFAQFSVDFSTYSDGSLSSFSDWDIFNSAGPDPFTVTSGQLVVDPADTWSGFSAARYQGTGGTVNSQYYQVDINFSLDFTNGTTSIRSGASAMPVYELQVSDFGAEVVRFALRHVAPFGGAPEDGNVFNIFVGDTFNGSNNEAYGPGFSGTLMGMAVDGTGLWTDGQSIDLILSCTAIGDGANNWELVLELINAGDSSVISTVSLSATDTDGSYSAKSQFLRMYPQNMQVEQSATRINTIDLFLVDPTAEVVTATLEKSTDLQNWVTVNPGDYAISEGQPLFFRARVEPAP